MGKRQHQKDKMYLTFTEWRTLYGGKKANAPQAKVPRLPFHYCSISLAPFENPFCDTDGNIFEMEAIYMYLKKYKCNPVTGKPMDPKSLVKLKFSKVGDEKFQCPVLLKELTPHSHIVAIASTGNVFSYEAVERLNLKPKSFRDLLTDAPFNKSDIITLQDPSKPDKFSISSFHHIKHNHRIHGEEESDKEMSTLKIVCKETKDVLHALTEAYVPAAPKIHVIQKADDFNAAHYSTGIVAAGFTSTAMEPVTEHEPAILSEDEVRYSRVKRKGYLRLVTNLGPLNLELYCDVVPKTCENFMKLCQSGYYNETIFHRSIRHFVVQGGDPTGTGNGGVSIWKKPFEDEIKPQLTHTGRGVLSMANSGKNANQSQFFITYRSCKYLDGKHTIFGKVVGGMDTLNKIERIEVDNKDRPIEDIKIKFTQVFVDPFQEVDDKLARDRREVEESRKAEQSGSAVKENTFPVVFKTGVGKYINPAILQERNETNDSASKRVTDLVKNNDSRYELRNFSSW